MARKETLLFVFTLASVTVGGESFDPADLERQMKFAIDNEDKITVDRLLTWGHNIQNYVMNVSGTTETALSIAVDKRRPSMIKYLAQKGAYVDAYVGAGTLLHRAISTMDEEVVGALLDSGAEGSAVGAFGWTALHSASKNNMADTIRRLHNRGACLEAKDITRGVTALHVSVENSNLDALNMLISLGSKVDAMDNHLASVLDYARKAGIKIIVDRVVYSLKNPVMDVIPPTRRKLLDQSSKPSKLHEAARLNEGERREWLVTRLSRYFGVKKATVWRFIYGNYCPGKKLPPSRASPIVL